MVPKILKLCVFLIIGVGMFGVALQMITEPWKLENYVTYGLLIWLANGLLKEIEE